MNKTYAPSQSVLDSIARVQLVLLVGPSASGKNTIISQLSAKRNDCKLVLIDMSRPPRPGEKDGVDAWFRTREYMEQRIAAGEYVQVAPNAFGDYYATPADSYSQSGFSLMPALSESVERFRQAGFASVTVIGVLPPSYDEWMSRLGMHGFVPDRLTRRLQEARRSLEYLLHHEGPYVINDSLDRAASVASTILDGGAGDSTDQVRGIITDILDQLESHYPATLAS